MKSQDIKPVEQTSRIVMVDVLRGWALIGVLLVNYFLFYYLDKEQAMHKKDAFSQILKLITDIFFTNKSRIMLNVLFGFGFSILIDKIKSRGMNPIMFFSRRMLWLFLIGLLNTCFYYGDFLKDYAMVGLLLLFFYKSTAKTSLYAAIFLMLLFPFTTDYFYIHFPTISSETNISLYESKNLFKILLYGLKEGTRELYELGRLLGINLFVLACFLVGQFLHKIDFFTKMLENKISAKKLFWASLISTILVALVTKGVRQLLKFDIFEHYNIEFWLDFGQMFILLTGICWLFKKDKLRTFFDALQTVGKMTLSNYIIQNVIGILLFSGFGLGLLHLPFYCYILIAITIYIIQIFFSKWWISKYNYGPVEWIWRMLSYGKILPLKKESLPKTKFAVAREKPCR
jgi:uncharacterized protein